MLLRKAGKPEEDRCRRTATPRPPGFLRSLAAPFPINTSQPAVHGLRGLTSIECFLNMRWFLSRMHAGVPDRQRTAPTALSNTGCRTGKLGLALLLALCAAACGRSGLSLSTAEEPAGSDAAPGGGQATDTSTGLGGTTGGGGAIDTGTLGSGGPSYPSGGAIPVGGTDTGGARASGGSSSETGGTQASGGGLSGGSIATGGASNGGSSARNGGSSARGGSIAIGGTSAGGSSARSGGSYGSGGSVPLGGAVVGGARASGGTVIGGTRASGGIGGMGGTRASGGTGGTGGTPVTGGIGGSSSGSGASCLNVSPCGGDVVGTWAVASSCLTVSGQLDLSMMGIGCMSAPVTGSLVVTGAWTARANGSYSDSTTTTGQEQLTLAPSCLRVSATTVSCSQMEVVFRAFGYESASCTSAADGGCACTAVVNQTGAPGVPSPSADSSGQYRTSGNVLTIDGQTQYEYCVSGNQMTWTPQSTSATTGTIVFHEIIP